MESTTKEYQGHEFFRSVCGKIGVAIGMRMVDADQVQVAAAGFFVGGEQIFGTQFVAAAARPAKAFSRGRAMLHGLPLVVDGAPAWRRSIRRIGLAGVRHHCRPGVGFDADHRSSQKWLAEVLLGAVAEHRHNDAALAAPGQFARDLQAAMHVAARGNPHQQTLFARQPPDHGVGVFGFDPEVAVGQRSDRRCRARWRWACASILPGRGNPLEGCAGVAVHVRQIAIQAAADAGEGAAGAHGRHEMRERPPVCSMISRPVVS